MQNPNFNPIHIINLSDIGLDFPLQIHTLLEALQFQTNIPLSVSFGDQIVGATKVFESEDDLTKSDLRVNSSKFRFFTEGSDGNSDQL